MKEITSRAHEWANSLIANYPSGQLLEETYLSPIRSSQKFHIGRVNEFVSSTRAPKTAEDICRLPYKRMMVEASVAGADCSWVIVQATEVSDTELRLIFAQRDLNGRWFSTAPFSVELHGETVRTIGHVDDAQIEHYKYAFALLMRTCLAMQCNNVRAERPAFFRKTTTKPKGGKQALFSHKVLVVDVSGQGSAEGERTGTHASPRLHLRRGHIRRLASGETVWVQPCVVGDKSKGMLTKDYRIVA